MDEDEDQWGLKYKSYEWKIKQGTKIEVSIK